MDKMWLTGELFLLMTKVLKPPLLLLRRKCVWGVGLGERSRSWSVDLDVSEYKHRSTQIQTTTYRTTRIRTIAWTS